MAVSRGRWGRGGRSGCGREVAGGRSEEKAGSAAEAVGAEGRRGNRGHGGLLCGSNGVFSGY